jgi:ribonuclease D
MTDFRLIETAADVQAVAEALAREPVIGVDTEADSFFHYFDKLCLLQIASASGIYIVDPLDLPKGGLRPLEPIFANPRIRKVFHAADYDLYVLQGQGGIRVRGLFDTMVSAQLLGYPAVGLAALVQRHFDIQLSKDQQRTDWSRRPLRDAQLEYAASDVAYLIELATLLEAELGQQGRLDWGREEFRALEERSWPEREFDPEGYLKIKGARKLSPRSLAILRELFQMRDKRARDLDRPPFKVLGNGTLFDLAQKPCNSRRALARRKGVTELVLRRFGQEIIDAIERGSEGPEHAPPERKTNGGRRRLDKHGEHLLEALKRWRGRRAHELHMDPGVFCPNATLEAIAFAAPETAAEIAALEPVKSWWAESFANEVIETLAKVPRVDSPPPPPRAPAAAGEQSPSRSARRRARKRRNRAKQQSAS